MKTQNQPQIATLASQVAEAVARRDALRAEMAAHSHRQGEEWYAARVDELHATIRRIHRLEDEQMAEERRHGTPLRSYSIHLGAEAQRVVDALLAEYNVQPEYLLRDAAEQLLRDAEGDIDVMECTVGGAQEIEETGSTAYVWASVRASGKEAT